MTPQELKNSILTKGFQGKLTSQRQNENVDQILSDCKEEKKQSIKEGKYRNEPFRGAIKEHEYNIPDNWCVMFISDMALFQEGPGILAADFRSSGVPLIRISGMQTQHVSLNGCNYLDPEMVESRWKHFKLDYGDILISTSASMDKVCEVYEDCVGAIPYTGQIRFKMYGGISKEYFKWYVQSPLYIKQINEQQAGAAIKHYGPTHLKRMTIPIPPLAEQKRIVAKIEELLPLIDRYENAWTRLEDFNKRFPGDMQKSILQMAIQGKLVEQRPEEGTGEELYQQIQKEKQALIKAGKIKKEKPLPEIAEDEVPVEIPESWKWCRVEDILLSIGTGKSLRCNETVPEDNKPGIIKVSAVTWGSFQENESKTCLSDSDWNENYRIHSGDFLISRANTKKLVGACVLVDRIEKKLMLSDKILRITFLEGIDLRFILHIMRSSTLRSQIEAVATGTSDSMKNISQKDIKGFIFPLPPLAEQKRIVARLEELLPLCEKLK